MVGGYDFDRSKFNRATQAFRQLGSAFKPIVYSAAIERIGYTPATIIVDAPISFPSGSGGTRCLVRNGDWDMPVPSIESQMPAAAARIAAGTSKFLSERIGRT